MFYVFVGFSCFLLFLHGSSSCSGFCFCISTSVGSHAGNRTETCYDLARVFPDRGLDEHHQENHSGSGCLCDVSCVVGFVKVTRTVCPSRTMTVTCRASAWQVIDSETRSNADAWAQASSYLRKVTACEGGNCSLVAVETSIFCVCHVQGTKSYVFSIFDCHVHLMSGSENGAAGSPSRAIVVV